MILRKDFIVVVAFVVAKGGNVVLGLRYQYVSNDINTAGLLVLIVVFFISKRLILFYVLRLYLMGNGKIVIKVSCK